MPKKPKFKLFPYLTQNNHRIRLLHFVFSVVFRVDKVIPQCWSYFLQFQTFFSIMKTKGNRINKAQAKKIFFNFAETNETFSISTYILQQLITVNRFVSFSSCQIWPPELPFRRCYQICGQWHPWQPSESGHAFHLSVYSACE